VHLSIDSVCSKRFDEELLDLALSKFFLGFFFFLFTIPAFALDLTTIEQIPRTLVSEQKYKEAIAAYSKLIEESSSELKSELKVCQTLAYYKDQDQEKAFSTFLDAIKEQRIPLKQASSEEEVGIYAEVLNLYLSRSGQTSLDIAKKIVVQYAPVLQKNPSYSLLGFLIAASYANLGKFDDFFELFYQSYLDFPDHFMVYKTKAILHIKLFERTVSSVEREVQRQCIQDNLAKAIERQPNDFSLYKMAVAFSGEKNHSPILNACLNKILDENMMIPRSEIVFYVQQAVEAGQTDLAQRFIDKARQWYQYSRVIIVSQQYLDQHR